MSLHYLLDGYNITHQIPEYLNLKLEDQRRWLVRAIESTRPQGSLKNKVTIVFDGQTDVIGQKIDSYVKVIFSKNESADDKIKKMIAESKHQRSMVVVTDDKDIQYAIGALGAKGCSVKEFLSKMLSPQEKMRDKNKRINQKEEKHISKSLERVINSEFENIWLKKK